MECFSRAFHWTAQIAFNCSSISASCCLQLAIDAITEFHDERGISGDKKPHVHRVKARQERCS
jgi:hypothetical protein